MSSALRDVTEKPSIDRLITSSLGFEIKIFWNLLYSLKKFEKRKFPYKVVHLYLHDMRLGVTSKLLCWIVVVSLRKIGKFHKIICHKVKVFWRWDVKFTTKKPCFVWVKDRLFYDVYKVPFVCFSSDSFFNYLRKWIGIRDSVIHRCLLIRVKVH